MKKYYPILFVFLLAGCAAGSTAYDRILPIMGNWSTDQGLTVTIRQSSENGYGAFITVAPGFTGGDFAVGKAVITGIRSLPDGKFSGNFEMPNGESPIQVQMALAHNDLIIVAWERRYNRQQVMTWHRMTGR